MRQQATSKGRSAEGADAGPDVAIEARARPTGVGAALMARSRQRVDSYRERLAQTVVDSSSQCNQWVKWLHIGSVKSPPKDEQCTCSWGRLRPSCSSHNAKSGE